MGIYDRNIVDIILSNTFYKIYEKPLSFSFPTGVDDDRAFKGWLATVAKNDLKAQLKESYLNKTTLVPIKEDDLIENADIDDTIFESVNLSLLNEALEKLPPRDREILITLYLYHEEGKNTPSEILDLICKIHDTTKANIRQIKRRSELKIIEHFSKHSQLIPKKHA